MSVENHENVLENISNTIVNNCYKADACMQRRGGWSGLIAGTVSHLTKTRFGRNERKMMKTISNLIIVALLACCIAFSSCSAISDPPGGLIWVKTSNPQAVMTWLMAWLWTAQDYT